MDSSLRRSEERPTTLSLLLAELWIMILLNLPEYFHGDFTLDDVALGEEGLNRLGNVVVPNECYGEISARVLPWLKEIEEERKKKDERILG